MSKNTQNTKTTTPFATPAGGSMDIPLARIIVDDEFNVRQVRDEEKDKALATSMKKEGQLQDVIVEPVEDGNFKLIAGYRRMRAAKINGWDSIRAVIWQPTNDKGEPLTEKKEIEVARYFVNLAENVARDNVTPFDLAFRCKMMKDKYDLDGKSIASRVGRNTSYVNNLLAIVGGVEKGEHAGNTLIPEILDQWKMECELPEDDLRQRVCNVQRLRGWVTLDHATQKLKFDELLYVANGGKVEDFWKEHAAKNGGQGTGNGADKGKGGKGDEVRRAGKAEIEAAIEAVKRAKKETPAKNKERTSRLNGILEGLEFALGVKPGYTNRITGVCAFKDGEMTEGAPKKEKAEKDAAAGAAN